MFCGGFPIPERKIRGRGHLKGILVFAIFLLPVVLLVACSPGINLKITKKRRDPLLAGLLRDGVYVNSYYRCAFKVHPGWSYVFPEGEEEEFVIFHNKDKSIEIGFKIVDLGEKVTTTAFVEKENSLHRELTQIKERLIKVRGLPAIDADFLKINQDETLKLKKIFFLKGSRGFIFTLVSSLLQFEQGSAKLYALVDSFRFLSQDESIEDVLESYKKASAEAKAKEKRRGKEQRIPPSSPYIVHIVKKGETLSSIAKFYTGDASKHVLIAEFNDMKYPYHISANDRIKIPVLLIKGLPEAQETQKDQEKSRKKGEEDEEEQPIYEPQ